MIRPRPAGTPSRIRLLHKARPLLSQSAPKMEPHA